jgi:hypothetical protein
MNREKLFKKYYKSPFHDYELEETLSCVDDEGRHPDISFIYSGRNRGKSYEVAMQCLADAWYDGKMFMYVRRYEASVFQIEGYFRDKIDLIQDMTDGEADGITYTKGELQFYKIVDSKRVYIRKVGYFIPLSKQGSHKSEQFPDCSRLLFEEVLTNETPGYLPGEPERLMNLISTVSRNRKDFRVLLVSNTISIVNPYSKAWGLQFGKTKPGEVRLTKLYLEKYDKDGNEEYYLIAGHYLKNKDQLTKEDQAKKRNRVKTSIGSNKWDEARLFTTLDLKFMKQYEIIETVIFEWDDVMLQGSIVEVPVNVKDVYIYDDTPEADTMPILYIRRKTSEPHLYTRVYTNNSDRFDDYTTRGFKVIYKVDYIVEAIMKRGWMIGADNLTMNDFDLVYKKLRLFS